MLRKYYTDPDRSTPPPCLRLRITAVKLGWGGISGSEELAGQNLRTYLRFSEIPRFKRDKRGSD